MDEPRSRSKRWIRAFFAVVLLACGSLATLNFIVNPYGYYPSRRFPALTWSSRASKVERLRTSQPEVLVLGSSRAMAIAPAMVTELTGKRAFNAAVDSARVEDWCALYRYARETLALALDEIILGVDIEAFHDHLEPDGRLLATTELRAFVPSSMRWQFFGKSGQALVGYVQTIDSVRSLRLSRSGYPPPPTEFDQDGTMHDRVVHHFDPSTAAANDPQYLEYENRFKGFTAIDPERRELFEALLAHAARDRVRIRAFVTPLHPKLVERLVATRDFARLRSLVVAYLDEAHTRFPGFSIVDYTDISRFGGDEMGFKDPAHVDDANARRLITSLLATHAVQ